VDYFSKLSRKLTLYIFGGVVSITIIAIGVWWAAANFLYLPLPYPMVAAIGVAVFLLYLFAAGVSRYALEPVRALGQAILHVVPGDSNTPAPNLESLSVGRELVTNLSLQVYQLASQTGKLDRTSHAEAASYAEAILDDLPVPLFVSDRTQIITYANRAAAQYLGLNLGDITGKNLYSVLDFSFNSGQTLDAWLADARANAVTASNHWDRVRLTLEDDQTRKQLDLAAYYNKNNPAGVETVLALFDKTKFYSQEDDGISFIALAVHELRTPLTILRGYIEVFEDEVADQLDPEMQDFMRKMQASAQQLSSFVSNILNVARVEENQLFLQLHEENWGDVLTSIVADAELRARVHDKKLTLKIEPRLPPVAVDRTSIYEVVNNLLDNAIKYSADSQEIVIRSYKRDDGLVETTVQDFGIGVPSSIIGHLFEKFYRNHRSRAQFGGTGLGLYLSKAIVTAHGGQIWIQSKEDEGSTFGFTLQPYEVVAKKEGGRDNKDIVRTAHGWIKNHSFYRR